MGDRRTGPHFFPKFSLLAQFIIRTLAEFQEEEQKPRTPFEVQVWKRHNAFLLLQCIKRPKASPPPTQRVGVLLQRGDTCKIIINEIYQIPWYLSNQQEWEQNFTHLSMSRTQQKLELCAYFLMGADTWKILEKTAQVEKPGNGTSPVYRLLLWR